MLHDHGVYRDVMSFLGAPDANEVGSEVETWRPVDWFVEQTSRQLGVVVRDGTARRRRSRGRR